MFNRIRRLFGKKDEPSAWEELWDARSQGIAAMLGSTAEDSVFHSPIPMEVGGNADVIWFTGYVPGATYVTCDLAGHDEQKTGTLGSYELMICLREPAEWAPALLSLLARYTLEVELNPGETMDIGPAMPEGSDISALYFAKPNTRESGFTVAGRKCGLLLCMGITAEELSCAHAEGGEVLEQRLRSSGVFPYTDVRRKSVVE